MPPNAISARNCSSVSDLRDADGVGRVDETVAGVRFEEVMERFVRAAQV